MKCKAVHKKLFFYLDDDLPEKEMRQVKQHLAHCNECAAFSADMQKTLGVLEKERSSEINPFFYTRLKARMENEQEEFIELKKRPALVRVLQPVFFSVLLILGIYGGFKIAQPAPAQLAHYEIQEEVVPYLNEMKAEPLETFLME